MTRREFQELAGCGKTTYFSLLEDPSVRLEVDYQLGPGGRAEMDRTKALELLRRLRRAAAAAAAERVGRLGSYASSDAPPRGRPWPVCGGRITRKACTCRHCGESLGPHTGD